MWTFYHLPVFVLTHSTAVYSITLLTVLMRSLRANSAAHVKKTPTGILSQAGSWNAGRVIDVIVVQLKIKILTSAKVSSLARRVNWTFGLQVHVKYEIQIQLLYLQCDFQTCSKQYRQMGLLGTVGLLGTKVGDLVARVNFNILLNLSKNKVIAWWAHIQWLVLA